MRTRLFRTIVVFGAALGGATVGCAGERDDDSVAAPDPRADAAAPVEDRCAAPGGGCIEHCRLLADGTCLDPCFVHTTTCAPDCVQPDGSCGWPPTK